MFKINFTNATFYWALILLLTMLIIYNVFTLIAEFQWIYILPVIIQVFLLFLVLTKNKLVKIALKIWAIIFLIIAPSMQILGKLLRDFAGGFIGFELSNYIRIIVLVLLGIGILIMTQKTVRVVKE